MDAQIRIPLRRPASPVNLSVIAAQPSINAACGKCAEWSGLSDKAICIETEMDPGQWSRIKQGQAHPSGDFLERLMDVCGNEAPLLWLIHRRGYEVASLRRRESDLENKVRILEEQLHRERDERRVIAEFLRQTKVGT